MKINVQYREQIVDMIVYLYIMLFVYAALTKILDFENFQNQLGQSPILSNFAALIAVIIPTVELVIAFLLMIKKYRILALFGAYGLMLSFTCYIYIILNYSDFVPCSCGGVLEKMTWTQHLIFNIFFCALAIFAIVLSSTNATSSQNINKCKSLLIKFIILSSSGCAFVILIFIQSQRNIHTDDNFIRQFPSNLYLQSAEIDLLHYGYYFAGGSDNIVYLGNSKSPLSVLAVDLDLTNVENQFITLDNYDLPFASVQLKIIDKDFYLVDGTIPTIFKGKINIWKGKKMSFSKPQFSVIQPIDTSNFVFRGNSEKNGEYLLGLLNLDLETITYDTKLLEKQIDGVFDSDGILLFNNQIKRIIYLYYYRNEFIVANSKMDLVYRGKTIDTVKFAKIKIDKLKNGVQKLATPPLIVNNFSTTYQDELFVNSNLKSRFETTTNWKNNSVIDVYDLLNKSYKYSFSVENKNDKKIHAMFATSDRLFFIIDNSLVVYKLNR